MVTNEMPKVHRDGTVSLNGTPIGKVRKDTSNRVEVGDKWTAFDDEGQKVWKHPVRTRDGAVLLVLGARVKYPRAAMSNLAQTVHPGVPPNLKAQLLEKLLKYRAG